LIIGNLIFNREKIQEMGNPGVFCGLLSEYIDALFEIL